MSPEPPTNLDINLSQAQAYINKTLDILDKLGILDKINKQLSEHLGPVKEEENSDTTAGKRCCVRLVIDLENYYKRLVNTDMLTLCGCPITIYVMWSLIANADFNLLARSLAHELLHVKNCLCGKAGVGLPYPPMPPEGDAEGIKSDHNNPDFVKKEKEFWEEIDSKVDKRTGEINKK